VGACIRSPGENLPGGNSEPHGETMENPWELYRSGNNHRKLMDKRWKRFEKLNYTELKIECDVWPEIGAS